MRCVLHAVNGIEMLSKIGDNYLVTGRDTCTEDADSNFII